MGGSELRSSYYMLRDLDPTANRYRAIVFGVNDYGDEARSMIPMTTSARCTL